MRLLRKVLSSRGGRSRDPRGGRKRSRAKGRHAPTFRSPGAYPLQGAPSLSAREVGYQGELRPEDTAEAPEFWVTCYLRLPQPPGRSSYGPPTAWRAAGGRLSRAGRAGTPRSGGGRGWSQGDRPQSVSRRPDPSGLRRPGSPRPPLTHSV